MDLCYEARYNSLIFHKFFLLYVGKGLAVSQKTGFVFCEIQLEISIYLEAASFPVDSLASHENGKVLVLY